MKNLIVAGAMASASFGFAGSASAVVYEPFDYNVGTLTGNTNNTAPSGSNGFTNTNVWTITGSATATPDVVAGNLSYSGLPASTGNMAQLSGNGLGLNADRIAIPDHPAGTSIYFSMIVKVPDGVTDYGSSATTGSFFTGFQYYPDTLGGMNFGSNSSAGPLTVRTNIDATGYQLGIAFRDAPAGTTRIFDTTTHVAGETLFLVGKLDIGAGDHDDVASLYINPDLNAEPLTATVVSANNAGSGVYDYFYATDGTQLETNLRSFILRNNGVEPDHMLVDEIRIGDSWADVTAVPEPASLAMFALGGLGLLARRRRA